VQDVSVAIFGQEDGLDLVGGGEIGISAEGWAGVRDLVRDVTWMVINPDPDPIGGKPAQSPEQKQKGTMAEKDEGLLVKVSFNFQGLYNTGFYL
jgi:hypothetical protein